jgi:FAD dependent oxidoreductase
MVPGSKYCIKGLLYAFLFVFVFIHTVEGQNQRPKRIKTDICIYGATSSGIIAAVTAHRLGKSVILIEPSAHVGGLSTGGLGQTDIGNKIAITGIARDFYKRIGKHYGKPEQWTFEPHVAAAVFNQYLKEEKILPLVNYELNHLDKVNNHIQSIIIGPSSTGKKRETKIIEASMFIDCTYEGDLMAAVGVSYMVGRESNAQYEETYNGVQRMDKHQFIDGIDPYKIKGDPSSGLLWGINKDVLFANGSGDTRIQAYNFRLCLTDNPSNRLPIIKPKNYDPSMFELLVRQIQSHPMDSLNWQLMHIAPMPNHKTDINNCGGFSSDMIGMNYDYPEASTSRRKEIIQAHQEYTLSWLYFLGHDERVPGKLRNEMLRWGLPKDEYIHTGHFTPQLYIREARRMIGEYVMTQHNCVGEEIVPDGIGLAAYTMDSHNCQRTIVNGMVKNEGDVQVGGFGPYPIAYRSLTPRREQCTNLLVPVCLSATHIAYGSIRMEPVFMILGQSAATAAALAIDAHTSIQSIDINKLKSLLLNNPLVDHKP